MKTYEHLRRTPPAFYPAPSATPPAPQGVATPRVTNQVYTIDGRTYNCNTYAGHTSCN